MLAIISPAKRLKFKNETILKKFTIPENLNKSEKIVQILRKFSAKQLQTLMDVNIKLAEENVERFLTWNNNFKPDNSLQALLAFTGDVFQGINAKSFNNKQFDFAQRHLRILSGLHGVLKPLDLIKPYRLGIGLKLKIADTDNLYDFWGNIITKQVEKSLNESGNNVLINLASNEYFKSINTDLIKNIRIITPDFREYKDGKYKFINVLGKKARGFMCRFIITNAINDPEQLKLFDMEGYEYNDRVSTENNWVFTRG